MSLTFNMIVQKLSTDFKIRIVDTRLNYYRNGEDWKHFHRDRHAHKDIWENYTLGASFGGTRELQFKDKKSGEVFSFPQKNGDVLGFDWNVNQTFLHSVPKDPSCLDERFSIIIWGNKLSE